MQRFASLPRYTLEVGECGIDAIPDTRLRELARYWLARCGSDAEGRRLVPERGAIEPRDLSKLLPNLMLLERVATPDAHRDAAAAKLGEVPEHLYRFRLAGTEATWYAGRELTGRFLYEVLPDHYLQYVRLLNRLAREEKLPVYSISLYHDQGNIVNGITYRLVLPLRAKAGEADPDIILACQFWRHREHDDSRRTGSSDEHGGGWWSGDWKSVKPEIRLVVP